MTGISVVQKRARRRAFGVFTVLFLALVLAALLGACSGTGPTAPASEPATTPEETPPPEGKALYSQKCAACHGANGEGTAAGPAIVGHSIAAIKSQMRNPMGTMPAFPPGQISDHEMDEIAEFIASLSESKSPLLEWEKGTTEIMHYWMALLAIHDGDGADAHHHLEDVLTFVKEPMHKASTEKALNLIAQGNLHDAEHEIEEMAGSESPSGITMQRFHLILAQRGVEAKSTAEVKHHLEHFVRKATEAEKEIAGEALELVEKGDFHEAEHEIEELLEMSR